MGSVLEELSKSWVYGVRPFDMKDWIEAVSTLTPALFSPAGGGVDDAARLQALAATAVVPIQLLPGTYSFQTPCVLPSGTTILGGPDVEIVQALSLVPYDPLQAAFAAAPTTIATTTLSANASKGAIQISVVANVAPDVGDYIKLSPDHLGANGGLRSRTYRVELVIGAVSPFTYRLDRPLTQDYVAGDNVSKVVPPQNIVIEGGNMTIRGVGQRFVEFAGAVSCRVADIRGFATSGDIPFSFDVGGLDCEFENIYSDGGGVLAAACIALESCERCRIVNSVARHSGAGVYGIALYDCDNCDVIDSSGVINGSAGLTFASDGNAPLGCFGCNVVGGAYNGNSLYGVWVQSGSSYIHGEGFDANYNSSAGAFISDGTNASPGCVFENCNLQYNVLYGAGCSGGSLGYFVGCDFTGNVNGAFLAGANFELIDCTGVLPTTVNGLVAFAAGPGVGRLTNCTLTSSRIAGINNFQPPTGWKMYYNGCDFFIGSTGIVAEAGTVHYVEDTRITEITPGVSAVAANGGTLRIGDGYDASGTTAAILFLSGYVNRGQTVTANNAVAVPVAWPDLRSSDRVVLTMATPGGAPTAMPQITYTPATGFTLTSYAGDTSVYDYMVL